MKSYLVLFIALFSLQLNAQHYGNEWINYGQNYYSFKIAADGIYKIDYNTLISGGVPLASIQSDQIHVMGFEREQPLFIEDGGDNTIDNGDYILFYGKANTTWLDSLLYQDPSDISNPYVPHYNDTITYFLTWDNQNTHARITEETDVNYTAYPANPYALKTNHKTFDDYYAEGFKASGLSFSQYVNGEGWSSVHINALSSINYLNVHVNTSLAYTGSGAPDVKGTAVSSSSSNAAYSGSGNHHLQVSNMNTGQLLHDTVFIGYQKNEVNFTFPASDINAPTTNIRHTYVNDQGAASDYQAVHFVELTYPHQPNLGGQNYSELTILNGTGSKAHYAFTNFNTSTPHAFAIDHDIKKIPVSTSGNVHHVVVPNSTEGEQKLIILDEGQIQNITSLTPVNGNGQFTDYAGFNFEDAYLLICHAQTYTGAEAYRDYRNSPDGGSHNAILLNIAELDLQFGGGVPKHIMGLRRFLHYAYNQTNTRPNHVFLIGKGIREANEGAASGAGMRHSPGTYAQCLIPTYGYPTSDVLISGYLEGNTVEPLIPIGRLAATNNQEVIRYLDKVKLYEAAQVQNDIYTIPTKLWQKEILHFGGGSNASEQGSFKSYLETYENLLESDQFGGHVQAYYKTVSDPINPVSLSEVNDRINAGVSLMTFFGHASATGFDQNVDDPENWNNEGKYPVVVGNACLTGNIHEPLVYSASESFVLIENKGAIAFIANVKQGFPQSLHLFSNQLFTQISKTDYGLTLGQQLKLVCDNQSPNITGFHTNTVLAQMTLHGDPALKPNFHQKPEIAIEQAGLFITPDEVDLTVDSIDVNLVLYNLGQSVTDTFYVEIRRSFPNNGGDSLYRIAVNRLDYVDTITLTIPLYANLGTGINTFDVKVDIPGVIPELYDEINNNQLV